MSEKITQENTDGRMIWVGLCDHCGEETLCERDQSRDEFCSVCARPLEDGNWGQEWIPNMTFHYEQDPANE